MTTGRLGEGKIALTWRSPYMEQEGMGDKRGDSERAASVLQCYQGQLGRRAGGKQRTLQLGCSC